MGCVLEICAGQLPPVVATGIQASGIWIEFGDWPESKAPSNRPSVLKGKLGRLRPLLWFMFFNKQEARVIKKLRKNRLLSSSLGPPDVPVRPT